MNYIQNMIGRYSFMMVFICIAPQKSILDEPAEQNTTNEVAHAAKAAALPDPRFLTNQILIFNVAGAAIQFCPLNELSFTWNRKPCADLEEFLSSYGINNDDNKYQLDRKYPWDQMAGEYIEGRNIYGYRISQGLTACGSYGARDPYRNIKLFGGTYKIRKYCFLPAIYMNQLVFVQIHRIRELRREIKALDSIKQMGMDDPVICVIEDSGWYPYSIICDMSEIMINMSQQQAQQHQAKTKGKISCFNVLTQGTWRDILY